MGHVSAHDDLNILDKIAYAGVTGGTTGRAGQMNRFAAGMGLTSQGIPFLHEGDEFLHSKVVGGDYEAAKNSYESGDNVNATQWSEKTLNAATFRYYKDAIALRKNTPALRLGTWDAVKAQMATSVNGSVVTSAISPHADAPTTHHTVVVYNPTHNPRERGPARRYVEEGPRHQRRHRLHQHHRRRTRRHRLQEALIARTP
ncbi:hypothetical protein [Streptomyces sp. NPDC058667]|uniref:hypothetical protein n=1 Tax=Streptomyces sp. NPDC058667 TaxID=3346588 RepID=UPI003664552C